MADDEKPAPREIDVNVTKTGIGMTPWQAAGTLGVGSVLALLIVPRIMSSGDKQQAFIQEQAAAVATQAKLDRQEERMNAQKTQEQLVKVVGDQIAATTASTASNLQVATSLKEFGEQVTESLDDVGEKSEQLIERVDKLVDHVERQPETVEADEP